MKRLRTLATIIAGLWCCVAVNAYDFEVDGIYYNITDATNLMVEVTHKGSRTPVPSYDKEVSVSSTVIYEDNVYSVTGIGVGAFRNCSTLISVSIPEGIISVGEYAFAFCSNLTAFTIPTSVMSIEKHAFQNCSGLTTITIPENVTSIEDGAFSGCSSLATITIPERVTSIGEYVFYGTAWYNNQSDGVVYLDGWVVGYKGEMPENTVIDILEGTIGISGRAFSSNSNLISVTIPASVESIGERAFAFCTLSSVIVPENSNLMSIGEEAFFGTLWDNNLTGEVFLGKILYRYKGEMPENTSYKVKEGTVAVADYAFTDCSGLAAITIPESVMSIGNFAFNGCTGLKEVVIEDGSATLTLGYAEEGANIRALGDGLFANCPLDTVYLGRNLDYKDVREAYVCSPFYANSTLESLRIGNEVTKIKNYLFGQCSNLQNVIMGKGIQNIEKSAFSSCDALAKITINAVTPPEVSGEIFSETAYTNATLYVPQNTLAEYQAATCWSKFGNIQESSPSTSIGTAQLITNGQESNIIYDLTGRCVEKTVKGGVYIVNGRKVLIR